MWHLVGPNIYPGVLSWLGVARELTAGTPLVPVITHPLDQNDYSPEDMPKFLDDKAIRGQHDGPVLQDPRRRVAPSSHSAARTSSTPTGTSSTTCSGTCPRSGSSLANPATVSGTIPVGATNCTLAAAPPVSVHGRGDHPDRPSAPSPRSSSSARPQRSNVVNFASSSGGAGYPVRFSHNASTVQTCGTPFTHKWAALNSPLGYGGAYGAQPPTHTLRDVTNIVNMYTNATYGTAPTNTYGARIYPSAVLKSLDFSGNAEQLLNIKMAGETWLSQVAGTAVTNVTTNSRPMPNWNSTVVSRHPGSTNITPDREFHLSVKRGTQVYWIVAGTQTPYIIARGPLTMDGSLEWTPTQTEQPLDMMLLNAQGPMVITASVTPASPTPARPSR